MVNSVAVTIDVDPAAAVALNDPATRARIGRLVSRALRPTRVDRLFQVMDTISDEARRRGVTDEILDEEIAAYNAERRVRQPAG